MSKRHLILLLCMLTLTACNLRYRSQTSTLAESSQEEIVHGTESTQIETLSASPGRGITGSPARACTPRTDWPQYVVVAGDTLSEIALRVNSSVAELAYANCLTNSRLIVVEQRLSVPVLPQ